MRFTPRLSRLALALSVGFSLTLPATLSLAQNAATASAANTAGSAYLRFPALRGDTLVFTSEGDLWRSSAHGGAATRLTTHAAEESRSAISHDGKWLAFSAAYEGPFEAYVMPLSGGVPKRISFEGSNAFVLGFTPQGDVLYSAQNQRGPNAQRVISVVNPVTLARRVLPLAEATEASLDDTGQILYFTRLGLAMSNDNAKKYRGGLAAQIWRFDLKKDSEATRLSQNHKGSDKQPMWWQGRVYFISDRDGSDNLWSMNPDGGDLRQLTRHKEWDVRNAAIDNGRIVYQLGADLHGFDLAKATDETLNISLASDYDQQRTRLFKKAMNFVTNTSFSSTGERVVVTARGHLALAGVGALRRVEIDLPKGSRARDAELSPDGKWVYAICDASGENEVWRFPADGGPGGKALTQGQVHRTGLALSPDGKKLAHTSKTGDLWLLDLASGKNEKIDHAPLSPEYTNLSWSPDSRLLALAREESSWDRSQIGIIDVASHKLHWLSTDKYHAHAPAFSPDGKWLYFISDRQFQTNNAAPWGDRTMGPHFDKRSKLFAYALAPERFPFLAKTELDAAAAPAAPAAAAKAAEGNDKPAAKPAQPVQWEGLQQRLYEVPLAAGNYQALQHDGKRLYFMEQDGGKFNLKTLPVDDSGSQPELFAADVREFALSGNGKKVYYQKAGRDGAGEMFIVDAGAKAPPDVSKQAVSIANWQFTVNPQDEWRQMFNDAWRMHRDYLFDPKMRGVDWVAMKAKYSALLPRVHDKRELNDLLAMMTGELSTLHSQIAPGELRVAEDGSVPAFLGATFDKQADGFRISHIYRSEDELPGERGPLAQAGLDIREGDVITAINGKPTAGVNDLAELLINQAGQQVLIKVKRPQTAKAAGSKAQAEKTDGGKHAVDQHPQEKQWIVNPVAADRQARLRYTDWEQGLRERVDEVGKGKIGYLHLRAMTPPDMNAFVRDFYANIDRDGLIIDVRRNNGGNIESWVIEKLLRRVWMIWQSRDGAISTNMQKTFRGHLAVLADELTYSDGETFTAGIKALKLGPVIGKRTAGAGVWLSDGNVLIDKGRARAAELAQFSVPGAEWLVEGTGVAPDIEVDNLPHATYVGKDAQLETALKVLAEKLKTHPVTPLKGGVIDPVGVR